MKAKLYIYTDNSTKSILAKIVALSIIEADKIFKADTGIDVVKKPNIGCQVKEVEIESKIFYK